MSYILKTTVVVMFICVSLFAKIDLNSGELQLNNSRDYLKTGSFTVSLKNNRLSIHHSSNPSKPVFETPRDLSFIRATTGNFIINELAGNFTVDLSNIEQTFSRQTVNHMIPRGNTIVIKGSLKSKDETVPYTLKLTPTSANKLAFDITTDSSVDRVYLLSTRKTGERYFGFGTQYTNLDAVGSVIQILSQEQGHGRGKKPLTSALNTFLPGIAGHETSTYAPSPHYITSEARSLYLKNYEYTEFDLTQDQSVIIETIANNLSGEIIAAKSVLKQIELFTKITGRIPVVPNWYHSGAIVCSMGGSEAARKLVNDLKRHGAKLSGLWIQDWTGSRDTIIGLRLWWTWILDKELYPDWTKLISELKDDGIELLTYINPFLTEPNIYKKRRSPYFLEAYKKGYFVKRPNGEPYSQDMGGFKGTLVDLTNPAARDFMKRIIKKELLGLGARGWMLDYGESLPFDAVLHSGESAASYHNKYVVDWAKLNREVLEETGRMKDTAFFMRAGHLKSPKYASSFWIGDQLTSWDKYDGIKTSVTGLLSSGFSGYSVNHSDIGGYASFNNFASGNITRSRELLYRWIELNAFTSLFRSHDGINPGVSYQVNTDEGTLAFFSRFSRVFAALSDYRLKLFKDAATKGYPVVRHPILHYPKDRTAVELNYQFMLGEDFMVAPVLDPGQDIQNVYLPRGNWVHLWSHKTYSSNGKYIAVDAPLGQPPVFYKKGSVYGENLYKKIKFEGLLN